MEKLKINGDFIERNVAGETVLIPVGNTALEFNGLCSTDEIGLFIWQQLAEECTRESLILKMLNEYNVERDVLEKDIDDFLGKLDEYKILLKN